MQNKGLSLELPIKPKGKKSMKFNPHTKHAYNPSRRDQDELKLHA